MPVTSPGCVQLYGSNDCRFSERSGRDDGDEVQGRLQEGLSMSRIEELRPVALNARGRWKHDKNQLL